MGIWDQYTALKWAKDNVAAFGGDPGQITLYGERTYFIISFTGSVLKSHITKWSSIRSKVPSA